MEEFIILPVDLCRICSKLQPNLIAITQLLDDEHVLIHEALEFISCIRIDFDDGMSQTMCSSCIKRLSDAYNFKNQVLDSYRKFYKETSDLRSENSIPENDFTMTDMKLNELGIELSTDAVSFLLEHNNNKTRNKAKIISVEENIIAEDETTLIEIMEMDENELVKIENEIDNTKIPLAEENQEDSVELPLIKENKVHQIKSPSKDDNQAFTIERLKTQRENNNLPAKPNANTPESKSSDINETSIKYEKNKYLCHICDKILPKRSNLRDHLRLHANERNFVCSTCQKAFVQIANYRAHIRVHTKERPYHCHLCPKTYTQGSSLKTHIRSHNNERNYVCEVCCKGFTNSSDLRKHTRIHDLSGQFECETCGHLFHQKVNLRVHQQNVHKIGT